MIAFTVFCEAAKYPQFDNIPFITANSLNKICFSTGALRSIPTSGDSPRSPVPLRTNEYTALPS